MEEKLKDGEAHTELLHRELNVAKEAIKGTDAEAREHIETAGIFKDKYMAAMKKLHEVHGQAELLQEELQYSQQQVCGNFKVGRCFMGNFRELFYYIFVDKCRVFNLQDTQFNPIISNIYLLDLIKNGLGNKFRRQCIEDPLVYSLLYLYSLSLSQRFCILL